MTAALPSLALVRRELLSTLRGWRAFALLFLFVGGSMAQIMEMWPSASADHQSITYEVVRLVERFMYLVAGGTVVCVPAFAAGAIVFERERGTFDLLRMTLARPSGVVASKLMNAVGFFFLLAVGLAPVVATAFFLPGFDRTQFAAAFAVIASMTVSCAAVGVMCSALFRRSLLAIAMSYVGIAMVWILPLILVFLGYATLALMLDVRSVGGEVESITSIVMPLVQLPMILRQGVGDTFVPAIGYQLLAASACAFVTHRRLLKPMNPPKVELRKPLDDVKVLRERRTTWPYYLVDPLRRKKPIEDGRNPMRVREIRWGLVNRGTTLIRLFYVALAIYFFVGVLAFTSNAMEYETLWTWFSTQCILTIIVAPALTANAVTKELELGNLDMLRMTLLRPRDVMMGKYQAAAFSLLPVLLAAALSVIPVAILVRPEPSVFVFGFGTLGVCTLLSLSIAIFFSTVFRRTLPAIVMSYVVSFFVFFVSAQVGGWIARRTELWDFSRYRKPTPPWEINELIYWLSPHETLRVSLGFFERLGAGVAFRYWATGSAAWTVIALFLLGASIWRFSRHRMRDR